MVRRGREDLRRRVVDGPLRERRVDAGGFKFAV